MKSSVIKRSLFIFLFLSTCWCSGEDYIAYQRVFNRIDQDILQENFELAAQRLDSIYSAYSFIYARHCIKALQISCVLKDMNRAEVWLRKCFLQGVPLWILRRNEITRQVFEQPETSPITEQYDSLYGIYLHSINQPIARIIDSLFTIDQRKTYLVNETFALWLPFRWLQWKRNNRRQAAIIEQITRDYGFPGERLIGLPAYFQDSATFAPAPNSLEPDLYDPRAYFMLIHYFSHPEPDFNQLLYKQIKTGYLPPAHFGALNDFQSRYKSKKHHSWYYNVWHQDPDSTHWNDINIRRELIGLSSLEEQAVKEKTKRLRRQDKTTGKTVLLE